MNSAVHRRIDILLLGLTSFLGSLYVFHENLKIALGPIDDHEIVRFLGSDKQLWLWQIPQTLVEKTEVGQFGDYARFRPVYYTIRMIETSAFGADSSSWYLARIIMVSLVMLFMVIGLLQLLAFSDRIVSIAFGIWFAFSTVSLTAWQDIVSRLGPAEIYLALEFATFFYLASTLVTRNFSFNLWLLVSITYLAAAGTKENGLTLFFPYSLLFIYSYRSSLKRKISVLVVFLSTISVSAIIAAGWILGTIKNSGDIYGGGRSLSAAISQLANYASSVSSSKELLFSLVAILFYSLSSKFTRSELSRNFFFIVIAQLSIIAIMAGEHIFYQGDFATLRYAVVGQLLTKLNVALSLILLINTFWLFKGSLLVKKFIVVFSLVIIALFTSLPDAVVAKRNFDTVAAQSKSASDGFQSQLQQIRNELPKKDFSGIVIQISNVWDYEPAYAFSQYLEFYGDGLPKYLHVTEFAVAPGLESKLLSQLKDYEANGDSIWLIQPRSQMVKDSINYCVTINGSPIDRVTCNN